MTDFGLFIVLIKLVLNLIPRGIINVFKFVKRADTLSALSQAVPVQPENRWERAFISAG